MAIHLKFSQLARSAWYTICTIRSICDDSKHQGQDMWVTQTSQLRRFIRSAKERGTNYPYLSKVQHINLFATKRFRLS